MKMIQDISNHIEWSLNISVDVSDPNNDHERFFEKNLNEHILIKVENFFYLYK